MKNIASPRLGVRIFGVMLFLLGAASLVYPLSFPGEERGDAAMADRYALWSKNLADDGYWAEALAALERAADFADVSSDISYLLALARSHENYGRGAVLEALEYALRVDRWRLYSEEAARLFKAEQLIAIRAYPEALAELSRVSHSPAGAVLVLKCLTASPFEFRAYMKDCLDRYPRESGPVRIFLGFLKGEDARGWNPEKEDFELMDLITRRLPALLLHDAELAWMAAPFVRDLDEAKRMVMAYRAIHTPLPASLPIALKLGIIAEETALEELFGTGAPAPNGKSGLTVDLALLEEIWDLLRNDDARTLFRRNLSAFSGVIIEDKDKDGIPETSSEYREGMLVFSVYNAAQDGVPDLRVFFEAGDPRRALALMPPESSGSALSHRKEAAIEWEQYPAVLEAKLDGVRYIPFELNFSPLGFIELWGSGVLFPRRDTFSPPLTRRVLVLNSLRVERPSLEFSGGLEVVELNQGIPVRAREYVGGMMVSETEFLRGRPQLQRVDLDLDGRMDTARRFTKVYRQVEIEELWDYDRDIDYTETIWE